MPWNHLLSEGRSSVSFVLFRSYDGRFLSKSSLTPPRFRLPPLSLEGGGGDPEVWGLRFERFEMKRIDTGGLGYTLAVDPSVAADRTGWAIFSDTGVLVACGKTSPSAAQVEGVTSALIERPVIYPHGKTPNPNDIVRLAVAVGEMAGVLLSHGITVRYVGPRNWKGTLDKHTCCRRAWGRLDAAEKAIAAAFRPETSGAVKGGKDHVLDAIGLGLYAVGRWRVGDGAIVVGF